MAEAAKANPNPTADTYVEPKANPKDLAPDVAARIAEQARSGNVRTGPNTTPDTTVNAERPAWLPANFESPEAAMKSLKDTQAELTRVKQELAKNKGEPVKPDAKADPAAKQDPLKIPEGDPKATEGDAEKAVAKAGFDMKALQAEFAEHGDITPESRSKLEKAGFTKDVVDSYIAGQVALAEKMRSDLETSTAGSTEKFAAMQQWAVRGLSAADKAVVNKAVDSGDPDMIKLAYQTVHAKWVAAVGQDPERVVHGTKASNAGDVYTHMDEVHKDIRSKEYQTNGAFRMKVVEKLKRSGL